MPDLIKLLPEGSAVISVIVVVLLFLKQQREQAKQLEKITESFNTRLTEVTEGFQKQINSLTSQIFEDRKVTNQQMQGLFDGFMNVSKETISAVVELRAVIEGVSRQVQQLTNETRRIKAIEPPKKDGE
jgi:methyl-accepting chemotaxis protein